MISAFPFLEIGPLGDERTLKVAGPLSFFEKSPDHNFSGFFSDCVSGAACCVSGVVDRVSPESGCLGRGVGEPGALGASVGFENVFVCSKITFGGGRRLNLEAFVGEE